MIWVWLFLRGASAQPRRTRPREAHMRQVRFVVLVGIVAMAIPAASASADGLNAYRVKATAKNLQALAQQGFDVTEGRDLDRGTIDVVGYRGDCRKARREAAHQLPRRPSAAKGSGRPDRRRRRLRLDGLDEVRRGRGRRQGAVHGAVRPPARRSPRHRRRARDRHHLRRARHHRPPGDQGRDRLGHPRPPSRPLQRDAARARVAGRRDLPAHARVLRQQLRQGHQRGQRGHEAGRRRPSCGSSA